MSTTAQKTSEAQPTRQEAMDVAESAREGRRTMPSFAAELFLGRVDRQRILPFPEQDEADRKAAEPFLEELDRVLQEEIDPDAVDRDQIIPERALERLKEIGAFRLKIPTEYGGLGFSQANYNRAVSRVSSWCGSTAILLSGHQSIGVPTPLKLFGTDEQRKRYLPRLAAGEVSAFALTEPEVGSDPARMATIARPDPDGDGWILDGEKLWCTNGPVSDILIVMARTPDKTVRGKPRKQISAFIVETSWPGFERVHRCEFMGYGGIQSGLIRFKGVRVPKENLLWEEGQGLKLALITLNTGRLTLPATNTAVAKQCLNVARRWAGRRQQWGHPVGEHEAVSVQIGYIASHTFAMEAVTDYASALADRKDSDIRLEAAMAKMFCSEVVFEIADRTLQIRAGRGYETARSLAARGEEPWPVERWFREARLNRIVEGTSEIMRLFLAREALDPHLSRAGALARPGSSTMAKVVDFLKCTAYYPFWYVKRLWPLSFAPADVPPSLKGHWRWTERNARRFARRIFHAMVRYGPGLEHRQALLGRLVDEGMDLTAMGVTIARAASRGDKASEHMAEVFCRYARDRIQRTRKTPASLDKASARLAREAMAGALTRVEQGIIAP